jgi:biopolymer transport protein ExbD
MGFSRRKREEPRVELTSMIDVVFLLLIFFMISTTFVETPGLNIQLPQASSTPVEPEAKELKIYLSQAGDIYLKDRKVSLAELRQRLSELGKNTGAMTFLLLADRETRHGRVVEVMDAAKESGFGKLAIATEEKPPR